MQPIIRTFVLADLKCYLCGASVGTIERERGTGPMMAPRVRCSRCGGAVYVDQIEIVDRRTEPVDWEDEGPRRGRPPKWLGEQRRRKRERELQELERSQVA